MTKIGDQLLQPETGWRRYNDDAGISYEGDWDARQINSDTYDGDFMRTKHNVSSQGSSYKFKFYGTKFRLITGTWDSYTDNAELYVDGKYIKTFNTKGTNKRRVLTCEELNLSLGEHEVKVVKGDSTSNYLVLDAIDIDKDGFLFVPIGTQLLKSEEGWTRYDDSDLNFFRTGTWDLETYNTYYNGKGFWTSDSNATIQFKFYGTKLRLLPNCWTNKPDNLQIQIDSLPVEAFSTYIPSGDGKLILKYEKRDLNLGTHTVTISCPNIGKNLNWNIDAIDIDGRLLHPILEEVFDPKDLNIGKVIRCHYRATDNRFGFFSGLGKETSDLTPVESSAAPNGDFYFIAASRDFMGRLKLVADRNIQDSITWDTLDNVGFVNENIIRDFDITPVIPKMTSNTLPTGNAFTSSSYNSSYGAFRAFNREYYGNGDTYWYTRKSLPQHLGYEFPKEKVVNYYSLRSVITVPERSPSSFTFEGYDGTNWIILDTQKGLVWEDKETKDFIIDNEKAYIKYRINVTVTKSGATALDEFNMGHINKKPLHKNSIRLLSGGVSNTDKNNEWDQIIVNNDLGGLITAGDNKIWNWDGVLTVTSSHPLSDPDEVVFRGKDAIDNYIDGAGGHGYRPVLLIEEMFDYRYLFEDEGKLKYYDVNNKTWNTAGDITTDKTLLESLFKSSGMKDLKFVDKNILSQLKSIKILKYTNRAITKTKVKAIPNDQLIKANDDMNLENVEKILSLNIIGKNIKMVASDDKGHTWYTTKNNGLTWNNITCDLASIQNDGIDVNTFNIINDSWNNLPNINKTKVLRFAYVLSGEQANTDNLAMNFDARGSYTQAVNSRDYEVHYVNKSQMKIVFKTTGDYKVNVIDVNSIK